MLAEPSPLDTEQSLNSKSEEQDQQRPNPSSRKRKPRSTWKRCLLISFTLIALVGCILVYVELQRSWYRLQNPHSWLYYRKPASEVTDWSEVVRPIISEDDAFDIVASVWVRDEEGQEGGLFIDDKLRPERLIYTDIVFRDLRLGGKAEFANVTLQIPTSHFKQKNISNYDLRASFVLTQRYQPEWDKGIKLDGVPKISSWKPNSLHSPPVRYWTRPQTHREWIYDSVGITIPLIQFHSIASQEPSRTNAEEPSGMKSELIPSLTSDSDSALGLEDNNKDIVQGERREQGDSFHLTFSGNPVSENHPYIVTRAHLGIIDHTKLYALNDYRFAQRKISQSTCFDPETKRLYPSPRWYQCIRSYYSNGVFETSVQVLTVRPEQSSPGWENLYAPHLTALELGPGPKDLVPVPLSLASTSDGPLSETQGESYVNVTLKLAFSSYGPANHYLIGLIKPLMDSHDMTAPENDLAYAQYEHELHIGWYGFRNHEDAHPRRLAMFKIVMRAGIGVLNWFFIIHYWYTRTSTTGISRFGTLLIASCFLLDDKVPELIIDPKTATIRPHIIIICSVSYVELLVMLKAVLRLKFGSQGGIVGRRSCFPKMYISKATHSERASARIEAMVSMRTKLLFLLTLSLASYLSEAPYGYLVEPLVHPNIRDGCGGLFLPGPHAPALLRVIHNLYVVFEFAGSIFQFVMNTHSQTYAGKYKISAMLILVRDLPRIMRTRPSIVGQSVRLNGFCIREGIHLMVAVVDVVQAVMYRSVKSLDVDETEE